MLASINWFCKSAIPTTFYFIREQGNIRKRRYEGEKPRDLYKMLREHYTNSVLVVHDQRHHTPESIVWHKKNVSDNFPHNAIVVKDVKLKNNDAGVKKWAKIDMFTEGLIHGEMSLNNVLHFAVQMKYDRILFSGVDLCDSRYFWLKKNEDRATLKRKGKKFYQKHTKADETLRVVKEMQNRYKQDMFVCNDNSMLRQIMPIWKSQ